MNERIKALAEQAALKESGIKFWWSEVMIEKFAESLIRECVGIIAKRKDQAIDDGWNVDEAMSMAEMDLKEHFGVKE